MASSSRPDFARVKKSEDMQHCQRCGSIATCSSLMTWRALERTPVASAHCKCRESASVSRSLRAKAGLAPPVEIASVTGPRFTMDGAMNEQWGGSSTALSNTPSFSASSKISWLTTRSLVAAMARNES